MAVLFANDTSYFSRTGLSLPPPFTVSALVRPTNINAWAHFLATHIGPLVTDGNDALYIYNANVGTLVTGRRTRVADGAFNFASLTAVNAPSQWYFVAFKMSAADHKEVNGCTMYWESTSFDSQSGNAMGTDMPTQTALIIGYNPAVANNCDGAVEDVRVWTDEISDANCLIEKQSATPVITSSLYAWYPFTDASGSDASGNGRNLTLTGSVSVIGGPRVLMATGNAATGAAGSAVNGRSILIRG